MDDSMTVEEMRDYLRGHYRYNTMNSWNNSTSYAHNMKVHHLGLTADHRNRAYDLVDMPEVRDAAEGLCDDFAADCGYSWKAMFNGRSAGYLVLYQSVDSKTCYPGRATDMGEDFSDWEEDQLRDRVELVQRFDRLRDVLISELVYYCENYTIVEDEVLVPRKVKRLALRVED